MVESGSIRSPAQTATPSAVPRVPHRHEEDRAGHGVGHQVRERVARRVRRGQIRA